MQIFQIEKDNMNVVEELMSEELVDAVVVICQNSTLLTSFMQAVKRTSNATNKLLFVARLVAWWEIVYTSIKLRIEIFRLSP